jgi:hypothetical protein
LFFLIFLNFIAFLLTPSFIKIKEERRKEGWKVGRKKINERIKKERAKDGLKR